MTQILQSFKILYLPENDLVMYSRLTEGRFAKTIDTPYGIQSEFIDHTEFTSALASLLLRMK